MKFLLTIAIVLSLSCSKESQQTEIDNEPVENPEKKEVVQKTVKEEFIVEKLTEAEKLDLLLKTPEITQTADSFKEVISFLDPYGETFAYMNFQDTKDKYYNKGKKLWELIVSNMSLEEKNINQIENFKDFVHSLGILDIDAVGLSHRKLENGLVKNKFALHRKPSDSPSLYWHSFGKSEKFDCVNLFPESTFFATGYRANLQILTELAELSMKYSFSEKSAEDATIYENKAKLLKSLDKMITGEMSLILFGDVETFTKEKEKYDLGYALFIKIRKEADLKEMAKIDINKFKALFEGTDQKFDKDVSIVRKGDYMIVVDKKHADELNSKKLLINKDKFKKKLEYVNLEGVMFNYLSSDLTDTLYDTILSELPQDITQETIDIFLSRQDFNYHFLNVMENRPEGFYYSGISTGGSYGFLMVNFLATFIHHFIFFDKFTGAEELNKFLSEAKVEDLQGLFKQAVSKVNNIQKKPKTPEKGSARETKNDLEFLKQALVSYSKTNNEYFPSPDGADGIRKLVEKGLLKKSEYLQSSFESDLRKITSKQFVESEISYLYLGANTTRDTAGYLYPLVLTKPGIMGRAFMAILANGDVVYFKTGGERLSSMLYTLNKSYNYNERQKSILREKFKQFN